MSHAKQVFRPFVCRSPRHTLLAENQLATMAPSNRRRYSMSLTVPPLAPALHIRPRSNAICENDLLEPDSQAYDKMDTPSRRSRRTSLPSITSTPQHFLQGVKINDEVDVFSIPDPPTPTHARNGRLSNQGPLRDKTNDIILEQHATEGKRNLFLAPSPVRAPLPPKRSRKSLCHVPSPHEGPNKAVANKRRKSLPLVQTFCTVKKPTQETPAKKSTKATAHDMNEIRELIHRCTAQKSISVEAKERIQALSGYQIAFPIQTLDIDHQKADRSVRMNVAMQLGPDLRRMDESKHKAVRMVQEVTGCRVERSNGIFRYIHLESKREVSPSNYEQRYMLMLDEMTKIRSKKWSSYFEKFHRTASQFRSKRGESQASDPASMTPLRDLPAMDEVAEDARSEEEDESSENLSSDTILIEDVHRTGFSPEPTMLARVRSGQLQSNDELVRHEDIVKQINLENLAANCCAPKQESGQPQQNRAADGVEDCSAAESVPHEPQETDHVTLESSITMNRHESKCSEKAHQQSEAGDLVNGNSSSSRMALLAPLPSRDEFSADPDIAKAESKLWAAIDAALEIYSQEVLAIQEARRTQTS